jgi:hypothetical protein
VRKAEEISQFRHSLPGFHQERRVGEVFERETLAIVASDAGLEGVEQGRADEHTLMHRSK